MSLSGKKGMATLDIGSIVKGNRTSTVKNESSTEAQLGSEKTDISDALESSETYPVNIATSGDDKIKLDEAAPDTSIEEITMDQQTRVEIEAEASATRKEQEKLVAKQATLHPEVLAIADSMDSKLDFSANLPSAQEPECSKQSEIQSTSRAAYQTAEGEPSEEISYYDRDEEEIYLVEVQQWVAADDHDYPTDKRYVKRYLTDKAADENSKSPSKNAKKSSASSPKKRKPSRATIMNPKTPQTPIKSAKKSREAMPTRATSDLSIDGNAQSVKKSTKTTPESSPKKCSSTPPTSPMESTTGHMKTAGIATKKRGRQH